jgi:ADP-heptose:LPS heptosyltransferase
VSASARWKHFKYQCRLASEAPFRLATRLRYGLPDLMLYFGRAPGDDLLCTALLRELRKRGTKTIWMMSNHPELFRGNPDVARVVPVVGKYERFAHRLRLNYRYLEYSAFTPGSDRTPPPARHIIAELCARLGLEGTVDLRPILNLAAEELDAAASAEGKVCIQSSGLAALFPMRNKQWPAERYQEVVAALRGECEFIQIGAESDPLLEGVRDLRGKTGKRETAALLARSQLFIGNVGFAMHLARAVECPSVILYGGREAPWQSGYTGNVNLYSPEPCAPCWRINECDFDRICMTRLTAPQVVEAVRALLSRSRGPLPVDCFELPALSPQEPHSSSWETEPQPAPR